MKIAIQAADLDNSRIDGTRVYLWNVLKFLGKMAKDDQFYIYHKSNFNSELTPQKFPNYVIRRIKSPFLWTQTGFAFGIWRDKVEALWMPMHNIPLLKSKKIKTTVTIHDLAFKLFPGTFPKNDLRRLNYLTDLAVKRSDKIIAVSYSTKQDILKFYPQIKEEKIKVIHHGFDATLFEKKFEDGLQQKILHRWKLIGKKYLLYVGAIQPRKDLPTLVKAFELFKKQSGKSEIKLVLAGGRAWRWRETIEMIENSSVRNDIVLTDKVGFDELAILYRNALLFVFPSRYEGFGIPLLEAFSAGVPVISADNSSLREVGGDGAEYFKSGDYLELAEKIQRMIADEKKRSTMIERGTKRLEKFSWEKSARETLSYLKNDL